MTRSHQTTVIFTEYSTRAGRSPSFTIQRQRFTIDLHARLSVLRWYFLPFTLYGLPSGGTAYLSFEPASDDG